MALYLTLPAPISVPSEANPMLASEHCDLIVSSHEHYDLTVSSHVETASPFELAPVEELGAQELVLFLSPYLS